jgi:hypothetical protein
LDLVVQRWSNLTIETAIAAGLAACYALLLTLSRAGTAVRFVPLALIALFVVDVGRINAKFMFLVDVPHKAAAQNSPVMDFLLKQPGNYRILPISGDPMPYAAKNIPVMFTSSPVQQQRWQLFLDNLNFSSPMLDIMNVKYLVYDAAQYQQERASLGERFVPVFTSPDGAEIVLENRQVLPKGWLVPAVVDVSTPAQAVSILQNPGYEPRQFALVESPSPIPMEQPGASPAGSTGDVQVVRYEGELVSFTAEVVKNSLLVTGEKFANGWKATVNGKPAEIHQVNYIQRGVYLPPGRHEVSFIFDPLSFKVGKWLTLTSFGIFAVVLLREWRRKPKERD